MKSEPEETLPISIAAAAGDVSTVTALLEAKQSIWYPYGYLKDMALLYASGHGHTALVKTLLEKGAKVVPRRPFPSSYLDGAYRARFEAHLAASTLTALHLAVKNKEREVVRILLRRQQRFSLGGTWRIGKNKGKGGLWMAALQTAVAENDLDMAQMLIKGGTHVQYVHRCDNCAHLEELGRCSACVDVEGRTALHLAAQLGYAEIVQLLLRHGANRSFKSEWRSPPLHLAAEGSHDQVVWILLEHGARVDELDKEGFSALYVAARSGQAKAFQLLRAREPDPKEAARKLLTELTTKREEPAFKKSDALNILLPDIFTLAYDEVRDLFFSSISNRNALLFSALLRHPKIIQSIGFMPRSYEFRLITSSGYGDLVEALIEHWPWRAEAKLAALSGIFYAGGSGSIRAVEAFLNWQWTREDRDVYLLCGLLGAIDRSRDATTEWLLKTGAPVNPPDLEDLSFLRKELGIFYLNPLHVAVAGSLYRICELLINNGADVNRRHIRSGTGSSKAVSTVTPLHLAAETPRASLVTLLLEHGARTEDTDGDGRTALHIAAHRDGATTVEALLKHDADIEARDSRGMTPLHVAGASLSRGAYAELIRLGADISARDGSGLCAAELQDLGRRVIT
ncbi:ankyrin repeat-containing domain protein [Aspergillus germanicus]